MSTQRQIDSIIDLAVTEDTEFGDITSENLIPNNLGGRASIIAKEEGFLVGCEVATLIFMKIDSSLQTEIKIQDGNMVKPGDVILTVSGRVASILKAERIALNFISHLSGVGTLTHKFVEAVKDLDVAIKDTRKTLPGLRMLEKYAVYAAGGKTHRPNLASGILIKDNHIAALASKEMTLKEMVEKAKKDKPDNMPLEIEVSTIEQLKGVIEAKPDVIMLDNMSIEEMKQAVDLVPEGIEVEASGGITLENVREIAESGVDSISVGAITHSAKSLDVTMVFV